MRKGRFEEGKSRYMEELRRKELRKVRIGGGKGKGGKS